MIEEWKDIKGYEGLYQVSNLGRIKSLSRNNTKGKILKLTKDKRGYYFVTLSKNNVVEKVMIHRVVAKIFLLNTENKSQVNHIDGNKTNNCVENLEWCTPKENIRHAWDNGLCRMTINHINSAKKIGKINGSLGKKKINQYDGNNNFIKQWGSIIEASNFYSIDRGNITKCCKGNRKKVGGFIWKYAE